MVSGLLRLGQGGEWAARELRPSIDRVKVQGALGPLVPPSGSHLRHRDIPPGKPAGSRLLRLVDHAEGLPKVLSDLFCCFAPHGCDL